MDIVFEHRDGWLQARVSFKLPRGTLASCVFRWGRMGPVLGQIVSEWLNRALRDDIRAARHRSYCLGYQHAKERKTATAIHPDNTED